MGILSRGGESLVRVARMFPYLRAYPNRADSESVEFVKNLASVHLRPEVVSEQLAKEVS